MGQVATLFLEETFNKLNKGLNVILQIRCFPFFVFWHQLLTSKNIRAVFCLEYMCNNVTNTHHLNIAWIKIVLKT